MSSLDLLLELELSTTMKLSQDNLLELLLLLEDFDAGVRVSAAGTVTIIGNIFRVSLNTGQFFEGETIVGGSSTAQYIVKTHDLDSYDQPFDSNEEIELEADSLLDFSENNPIRRVLMLGTYYYHEIIRKTIISFGTLFNNINIKHKKSDGTIHDDIKVGLAYGPQQKYLAKIQKQAELSKAVAITLPRMSFEMNNIQYDSTRKSGITQTFKAKDGDKIKKVLYACSLQYWI